MHESAIHNSERVRSVVTMATLWRVRQCALLAKTCLTPSLAQRRQPMQRALAVRCSSMCGNACLTFARAIALRIAVKVPSPAQSLRYWLPQEPVASTTHRPGPSASATYVPDRPDGVRCQGQGETSRVWTLLKASTRVYHRHTSSLFILCS
jgi:hypothetical protein